METWREGTGFQILEQGGEGHSPPTPGSWEAPKGLLSVSLSVPLGLLNSLPKGNMLFTVFSRIQEV